MQVFLPYPDFESSVGCLDSTRLGNQIYREAKTLITGGWPNHPAAKLWANHRKALANYCLFGLEELTTRDNHYPQWYEFFGSIYSSAPDTGLPPIIGNERFHSGHRAALLAKGILDETYALHRTGVGFFPPHILKRDWTWNHAEEISTILGGYPPTHYSHFGWTETPEPDTKRAYIWSI